MFSKEIFRKVSLDRLASPEQLDQLLEVTTGRSWVALLALCGVLGAGITWSLLGSSATTVAGRGVIVRRGGVFNVVTLGQGRVMEVRVKVGDLIRPDQVIALVAQPGMVDKLENAREELKLAHNARDRMVTARGEGDDAKRAAMRKHSSAIEQEIRTTQDQIRLAREQIPVDEQLVSKGLITKQSAIQNQQRIAQLEGNVSKLRAQLEQLQSENVAIGNQSQQMELEYRSKIEDLTRNIKAAELELQRSSRVISTNAGRVVELKVYPGAIVGTGAPIVSIEPLEKTLEVVVYVPSGQAKEITAGMEADVSPSGIQREEYGYLIGRVRSVNEFPATIEAITRNFENETLARSMLDAGPVTELRAGLEESPDSFSGYKWSSPKGPPSKISSGAVCSVAVVTREQPPISLVLPYFKKKLGL